MIGFSRFFGNQFGFGGGEEEEEKTPKGDQVSVDFEVTLEELYVGTNIEVGM